VTQARPFISGRWHHGPVAVTVALKTSALFALLAAVSQALVSEPEVVGASADTCHEAPQRGGPKSLGKAGGLPASCHIEGTTSTPSLGSVLPCA
jgi:hypothetical protein